MDGRGGQQRRAQRQPRGAGGGRAYSEERTHQQGSGHGNVGPRHPPTGWSQPREERRVGSGRILLQEDGPEQGRPTQARQRRQGREAQGPSAGCSRRLPWSPGPGGSLHHTQNRAQRIGFGFLKDLLQKDPSEVAITLASCAGLKEVLSQTAMQPRFLQLLCQVLCKACCSRIDRQSIQQLMDAVKESSFLKICLPQYVADMLTEATAEVRHQYPEHLGNIVTLVQELVSIFPASSIQKVAVVMSLLPGSVNALRALGVDFTEEMDKRLEKVQAFIKHLQERRREGTLKVDSCTLVQPLVPGEEEDYRSMSVYPTYKEVHHGEKPFLRPNIISQPYESPAVYLDTHFRLLREDFVRPLREGILQLLHSFEDTNLKKKRFDDIRVYFDTRILVPLCSRTGIDYKVQFNPKPLSFVCWENSKRLLYGSLVCMSKDNFETFLFATVSQRDTLDLQKGVIHLAFSKDSQALLAEVQPSDSFLMVETTAYFEAYRHVLQGLQEMQEEDVPFQKYIVCCEADVREPAYLGEGGGSIYDLTCLMKAPDAAAVPPPPPQMEDAPVAPRGLGGSWVDILDPCQWPEKEALGLDESQLQALQLAFTKELAIIQGPPGTGKTYVGLKIVEALLSNKSVRGKSPILIVCYTNHALDQFLEGICMFQKEEIVRVGGRSNSETLKRFTLQEHRSKRRFWESFPRHLNRAYSELTCQMREAEVELHKWGSLLECGQRGVLRDRQLRKCIARQHWDSLTRGLVKQWMDPNDSVILEWLGLGILPTACNAVDLDGPENAGAEEEGGGQELEVELLLPVVQEADLIQAERLLDYDEARWPQFHTKNLRQDKARLDDLFLALNLEEKQDEVKGQGGRDGTEDAAWELQQHHKKKMKKKAKAELHKVEAMTKAEAGAVLDVWRLDLNSRWKLYRYWLQEHQAEIRRQILRHEQTYQAAADRLAELRLQQDLCILKAAKIVGMTTTGAARYRQVLQQVAPCVVVVEEAAEVLEAHTITTLSKACQHLILIGDHQQLRPSANVHDLAKNFNLEVSLFERLVQVGLPFIRLGFQHRMRPEIAQLLTPHVYQGLENHPSVLHYENIQGVSSNLFFVEHNYPEEEIQEGKSHQNPHEAQFVVALCRYLLCQDYLPSQITILTTYTGQLFCLRKLLPAKTFQGVKVHVVDKYQGEENDIILLSLVRSNPEGRVGFLQTSSRVCVALSRAKKGLYCIGNMMMLSKVPLWSKILHTLREKGCIGQALQLSCQNHPQTKTEVAQAADFSKVPEGGCSLPCDARLNCGHVCPRACHPYDPQHQKIQCMKPCQKVLCEDGHRCPQLCFEACGKCLVKVPKTMSKCGHHQQVPCSTPPQAFCCQEPCGRVLKCGHICQMACGQECTRRCPELLPVTLKCGHSQEVLCSTAAEMEVGRPVPCKTKCHSVLDCGHPCPGSCQSCFGGRFHEPCRSPCKRFLVCSHKCLQPCTSDCPPCQQPCQNRCIHSRCQKKCGEPCCPCVEPCEWRCQHHQCSKLCSEPCDRPRCNVPCPKHLLCGHPCAGLCGEPCPEKCLVCNQEELTEIFFGCEDEPDARFVQLEDCSHIFETQGMDCYMEGEEGEAVKLKVCPRCQTPIRKNLRYGTMVKRSLAEVEVVKGRIQGSPAEISSSSQRLKAALLGEATLKRHLPVQFQHLKQELEKPAALSTRSLGLVENLLGFYVQLANLTEAGSKVAPSEQKGVRRRLAEVTSWLERPRCSFTGQEVSELQCEFQRLTYLVELLAKCRAVAGTMNDASVVAAELVSTTREILEGPGRFTPEDESLVKAKMEALKEALPTSGLGISDVERRQIVTAVTGTTRGHWFKCPNGHIYAIGECGGAMQRGCCPECQEVIGGSNHRLEPSNQLASEMDGATHAAWSETANNLLNVAELWQ
ncbi:NFX1-type zinc finger-containing protein 1 isoform X2 [Rhineura floridana]|uniref:NFX1-type zinc finger-containing protein 1 isoform X2 n=1 Tax=Rhineura floridana TaxID=261503 RepID=UPI002AC862A1|nr:NFX1-type zinc finger-containing protein 1 isoform X2 [Rhineura floridana]